VIVIDTSAVLAILTGEPEAEAFNRRIAEDPEPVMSAGSYTEAGIVLQKRLGAAGLHYLLLFVSRAGIRIEPVTPEQAEEAVRSYARFGKGNHEAALNFGDCFVHALARERQAAVLYKGTDFARTDLEAAV
jgi:ribonuclease VapC